MAGLSAEPVRSAPDPSVPEIHTERELAADSEPDLDGPRARILHVDDDPAITRLSAAYLAREDESVGVVTAKEAGIALEVLQSSERKIDCIVSDYEMPGQDGLDFANAVRRRDRHVPFILFSAKGRDEIPGDARAAGVTHWVPKGGPSQFERLVDLILEEAELGGQR